MADLRFGIIGAGNVGVGTSRGDSFAGLLAGLPGAAVTAIYDIAPANAERAAKTASAQPFSEFEPFLESGLDAVVVCSPIIFHAEQSVAALERNIHVLSEVPAVHSTEAARQLASAAARSNGHYMLAENYCYLDEIELVKRLAQDGRFGEVYFAEGEYVHDCRDLWVDAGGKPTWRGLGRNAVGPGVYCTHSLGPLLFILQDRVVQVSALANESNLVAEGRPGSFNFIMLMRTAGGRTLKVRVDTVSPRPHQAAYYSLQGTAGAYESWRGLVGEPKIWLSDEHEESHCFESAAWHPLMAYASRYTPERLAVGDEARAGGHGTSEYWMVREFIGAIQRDAPPPIGVHEGLDYTLPGLAAVESASASGEVVTVPDPRGM